MRHLIITGSFLFFFVLYFFQFFLSFFFFLMPLHAKNYLLRQWFYHEANHRVIWSKWGLTSSKEHCVICWDLAQRIFLVYSFFSFPFSCVSLFLAVTSLCLIAPFLCFPFAVLVLKTKERNWKEINEIEINR